MRVLLGAYNFCPSTTKKNKGDGKKRCLRPLPLLFSKFSSFPISPVGSTVISGRNGNGEKGAKDQGHVHVWASIPPPQPALASISSPSSPKASMNDILATARSSPASPLASDTTYGMLIVPNVYFIEDEYKYSPLEPWLSSFSRGLLQPRRSERWPHQILSFFMPPPPLTSFDFLKDGDDYPSPLHTTPQQKIAAIKPILECWETNMPP